MEGLLGVTGTLLLPQAGQGFTPETRIEYSTKLIYTEAKDTLDSSSKGIRRVSRKDLLMEL